MVIRMNSRKSIPINEIQHGELRIPKSVLEFLLSNDTKLTKVLKLKSGLWIELDVKRCGD